MTQATGDAEKLIKLMTNSSVDNCDQIDVGVATQVELQRVKNKPLEIIKFRNGAKKFMIEMGKNGPSFSSAIHRCTKGTW